MPPDTTIAADTATTDPLQQQHDPPAAKTLNNSSDTDSSLLGQLSHHNNNTNDHDDDHLLHVSNLLQSTTPATNAHFYSSHTLRHQVYTILLQKHLKLLSMEHRQEMKNKRRISDTEKAWNFGIRSFCNVILSKWKDRHHLLVDIITKNPHVRIPGVLYDGRIIKVVGRKGLYLPAWTPAGEIIGAQLKPDPYDTPEAQDPAKYVWFSVPEDQSEFGTKPHHLMYDAQHQKYVPELPLFYVCQNLDRSLCVVPAVQNQTQSNITEAEPSIGALPSCRVGTVGLVEGAYKSYITSQLINLTMIGYAGSLEQSRLTLLYYLRLIQYFNDLDKIQIILFPDAGMSENFDITLIYLSTLLSLEEQGFECKVAFWDQGSSKNLGDIDELEPEQHEKIRLLSMLEFADTHCKCVLEQTCLSNPDLKKVLQPLALRKPICTIEHEVFFRCDVCNFHCADEYIKNQHMQSASHKNRIALSKETRGLNTFYCSLCKSTQVDADALQNHITGKEHRRQELNSEREKKLKVESTIFCRYCNFGMPLTYFTREHSFSAFHRKRELLFDQDPFQPQYYHIFSDNMRAHLIRNKICFRYQLTGDLEEKTIREVHDELASFSTLAMEKGMRVYEFGHNQRVKLFCSLARMLDLEVDVATTRPSSRHLQEEGLQNESSPASHAKQVSNDSEEGGTDADSDTTVTQVVIMRPCRKYYHELQSERLVDRLVEATLPSRRPFSYSEDEMKTFENQFLEGKNATQELSEWFKNESLDRDEIEEETREEPHASNSTNHICELRALLFINGIRKWEKVTGHGENKKNAKRSASINFLKFLMENDMMNMQLIDEELI